MSIKRPVQVISASGHIDDAKGRELLSTSRDDDSCEEIAACINLAPRMVDLLRRLQEIVSDAEYDDDPYYGKQARALNDEREKLLAEWDTK